MSTDNACLVNLLVLLLIITLTTTTSGAPVDDVCRQTKNPALCLRDFSLGEPNIRTQTIQDLSGTVIRKAKLEASQIARQFHVFVSKPGDRDDQCEKMYNDATTKLGAVGQDMTARRYEEAKTKARDVKSLVDRCETVFGGESHLRPWTPDIVVYTEAIVVIVDMLPKS